MAKNAQESAEKRPFRFEEGLTELESIVESLESGSLGLEDSIRKYEEGMTLYRRCAKRIDDARRRIEKLIATPLDGEGERVEPFEHADAGTDAD